MLYPLNSTPQVQPVKIHKKKKQWEKSEQKTKIMETVELEGEKEIKKNLYLIKLLWKVVVNSNNDYVINVQRIISVQ